MATIAELEKRVKDLRAKAFQPANDVEKAEAELAAARAAAGERESVRGAEWDTAFLDTWEEQDAVLQAEERQARIDLIEAVKADPVWSAWMRTRSARARRSSIRSHAESLRYKEAIALGENPQNSTRGSIPDLSYRDPGLMWKLMLDTIEDAAKDAGADQTATIQEQREAYAEGTD